MSKADSANIVLFGASGVANKRSQTETCVALKLQLDN